MMCVEVRSRNQEDIGVEANASLRHVVKSTVFAVTSCCLLHVENVALCLVHPHIVFVDKLKRVRHEGLMLSMVWKLMDAIIELRWCLQCHGRDIRTTTASLGAVAPSSRHQTIVTRLHQSKP